MFTLITDTEQRSKLVEGLAGLSKYRKLVLAKNPAYIYVLFV